MPWLEFDCRLRLSTGFQIEAAFQLSGRIVALWGPSGSGKSTILSMIAGGIRPDSGSIKVNQKTWYDSSKKISLLPEQRSAGVVFQDQWIFPHLNVRSNLLYGWKRRGTRQPAIIPERVIEILELQSLLARNPRALSGGERQRVALGRALLCGPEILLLDEPWGALDVERRSRILEYLKLSLNEWKIPALLICHEPDAVEKMADQIFHLSQGKILHSTTPKSRNAD